MLFKDCERTDGRTDGRRRRTVSDHNSSPWAFGSGELKKKRWVSTGNKLGWLLIDSPSYVEMKRLEIACVSSA